MKEKGLIDDRIVYTPFTAGMDPPPFYHSFLKPFLSHPVQSLDDISSREHMISGVPRCFDQLLVCTLISMYKGSHGNPSGIYYGHWDLHPKLAGKAVADYYKQAHPKLFPARKPGVFHVVIGVRTDWRRILNLDDIVKACNAWKPPAESPFERTECITRETKPDTFVEDLGIVNQAHALVITHGAAGTFSFTMQDNSSLIEVMSWDFCGYWSRQYFEVRFQRVLLVLY